MFILGYHDIEVAPSGKRYSVSLDMFKKHLSWLKTGGFKAVSLQELEETISRRKNLPKRAFLLTFDDGLSSHYKLAYPLLKEYGYPACFFVIASSVNTEGFLRWGEIKTMIDGGMHIGSHGLSHRLLNTIPEKEVIEEFGVSKNLIEKNLGVAVNTLSIPRGQESAKIRRLAQEAGYKVIFVSRPGYITAKADPSCLKRFFLTGSTSLNSFRKIALGNPFTVALIKLKSASLWVSRKLLGMGLYEKIRKAVLKEDYS